MKISNLASFPVLAFGWHGTHGYGEDVLIAPGASADVSGPYIGEMGGGSCFIHLDGAIACHEAEDTPEAFHIAAGQPVCLGADDRGITLRHHEDAPEPHVAAWRASTTRKPPEDARDEPDRRP